jgi:hypothetical protein
LVVEDGTGLETSNSYVSLEEFQDYWELRNDATVAALSDEDATAALVKAAQFLDYTYRWVGDRYSALQAMSWPRVVFFDRDARAMYANVIPQRLKDAQCELARESAVNGLTAVLDRGGRVQNETVGPLSVTYFSDATGEKSYPLVDRIIADLITPESAGSLTLGALLS